MDAISNAIRRRDGRLQQTQVVERNSLLYTIIISFYFVLVIPQSSSTKMERLSLSAQHCITSGHLEDENSTFLRKYRKPYQTT
jgi:hypothetical protein